MICIPSDSPGLVIEFKKIDSRVYLFFSPLSPSPAPSALARNNDSHPCKEVIHVRLVEMKTTTTGILIYLKFGDYFDVVSSNVSSATCQSFDVFLFRFLFLVY